MLVVLTEEESMEVVLREVFPKLGVFDFRIIAFQGVSDLEGSLGLRLRGWRDPRARFLIIRDNDNGDCRARKTRLLKIIEDAGRESATKVRIVMQELEAWFLGDPEALEAAGLLQPGKRPGFLRDPEAQRRPVDVLRKLDPAYQKSMGAGRIAPHLDPARNAAPSFHATIAAIRELTAPEGA